MKDKKQQVLALGLKTILILFLISTATACVTIRDCRNNPDSSDKPPGVSCDDGEPGDFVHCSCDSDDDKACSDWLDSNCDRYDEGGWVCEVERRR